MEPQKLCELHVHIEGCVWNEHIQKWWNKSSYLFPPLSYYTKKEKSHFDLFLEQLRFGYNFLNSLDAYAELFRLYIEKALKQNVFYAEVQINYALIKTWNINLIDLLKKVNKNNNTAFEIRFIIDLPWQFNPKMLNPIIENQKTFNELGVVGIGFGGDEKLATPHEFIAIRERIIDAGYKILCHAGETTESSFAKEIIEIIKPDRIAHGLSLISDIVKNPSAFPPIDICLSSNIRMGLVENIQNHPFQKLIEAGAIFTLSTDDPAIFDIDLDYEYTQAKQINGFNDYMKNIKEYWYTAAFDKSTVANILYK